MASEELLIARAGDVATLRAAAKDPDVVTYVAWGGATTSVATDMDLGRGVFARTEHGLRRAVWDAAFGVVSGFKARHILYYVLTRSLSKRVEQHILRREDAAAGPYVIVPLDE